ncbi:MAG: ThiF family adenylyltransferase [Desulfurococcales archaeon]|nr:ThiF family adenylyltransferase [Desulfurococcales archaeon]
MNGNLDIVEWLLKNKIDEIYDRQLRSRHFTKKLLEKLENTRILVPGCGALGSAIASMAVRLGIRKLRIVDHDFSQPSNFPRTSSLNLYDSMAGVPKVLWCKRLLEEVNPEAEVEAVFTEISPHIVEELLKDIDVVMDGLDNVYTRNIIAYYAYKSGIPYIYAGVEDVFYQVIPSIPGVTPCVSCLLPEAKGRQQPIPVFVMTVFTAASTALMTLLKLLGDEPPTEMIVGDVFTPSIERVQLGPPDMCKCKEPSTKDKIVFTRNGLVKYYPSKLRYIDTGGARKICSKLEGCTNTIVSDWFFRIYVHECMATVYLDGRMEAPIPCDWLLRKLIKLLRLE